MRDGKGMRYAGLFVGVVVLVGMPIGIIKHALDTETMNRSLVSAIKSNAIAKAIQLLDQGADANAHDEPRRSASAVRLIMEALNLKRRPPVSGPSALYLALRWRSKPGASINLMIQQTTVIQALRDHGARLAGPEIAAYMTRAYAVCSSYQDKGTVSDAVGGMSFHTAFIRPNRLFFECTHLPGSNFALWENDHGVFYGDKDATQETTIDEAIVTTVGASSGISEDVPYLLFADQFPTSFASFV